MNITPCTGVFWYTVHIIIYPSCMSFAFRLPVLTSLFLFLILGIAVPARAKTDVTPDDIVADMEALIYSKTHKPFATLSRQSSTRESVLFSHNILGQRIPSPNLTSTAIKHKKRRAARGTSVANTTSSRVDQTAIGTSMGCPRSLTQKNEAIPMSSPIPISTKQSLQQVSRNSYPSLESSALSCLGSS